MSRVALVAACVLLPAIGSPVRAQDVTPLEGIVIHSANRTPTDAAKVGSSVEVITEKDLEARSQTYVKDYLETLPGVHFSQSGPPGSGAGIRIRGGEGRYVKVLIDGIDVSDPSNTETAAHLEHLLVGDVARIEVLKGPQSTLFGGDAVSGVISIETKVAAKQGFSQRGSVEYGAYNTWRGAATTGFRAADGSNISFTAQGVNSDGFSAASAGRENDGYRNLTFSGRGEYYLSPSAKIFFAARSVDAKHEYDGTAPVFPYAPIDADAHGKYKQQAGRVGTEFTLLNGAFQNTFAFQAMQIERDQFSSGVRTSWFEGDRIKAEYKGVLRFNNQLSLLFGGDWEETRARTSNDPANRFSADVASAYAQLMLEPIPGLALAAGGRIDDHSNFGEFSTYRFTGAYLIPGTETKLRGNIGTSFRAPSLDEMYTNYPPWYPNYGNPNLKPEESKGWEVGIEQGFNNGRWKFGATYFHTATDNLIAFDAPPPTYTCGVTCMVNIDGTTVRNGVELTASVRVSPRLGLSSSYTYIDTERGDDGARIARVPRHMFTAGVEFLPLDKVEANVVIKYVADTLDAGDQLDDYFLLSAKISYEFMPGVKAYIRGENLLDEKYQTVRGYGTAGASVYGGFQFALPNN